eukprot:gnl/Hemi2/23247_TR7799_c0_g1_i1.p1 gnl/Hemi2/23247_TR7799_c0_g1~~gnl/Hemi2/23247_TR7799_c0_g1_i1.p1  ORF type:complete len:527 (-),score=74.47 gnl/Hemi2/23247_TR7799_c0_g1_i1:57-1637(-)
MGGGHSVARVVQSKTGLQQSEHDAEFVPRHVYSSSEAFQPVRRQKSSLLQTRDKLKKEASVSFLQAEPHDESPFGGKQGSIFLPRQSSSMSVSPVRQSSIATTSGVSGTHDLDFASQLARSGSVSPDRMAGRTPHNRFGSLGGSANDLRGSSGSFADIRSVRGSTTDIRDPRGVALSPSEILRGSTNDLRSSANDLRNDPRSVRAGSTTEMRDPRALPSAAELGDHKGVPSLKDIQEARETAQWRYAKAPPRLPLNDNFPNLPPRAPSDVRAYEPVTIHKHEVHSTNISSFYEALNSLPQYTHDPLVRLLQTLPPDVVLDLLPLLVAVTKEPELLDKVFDSRHDPREILRILNPEAADSDHQVPLPQHELMGLEVLAAIDVMFRGARIFRKLPHVNWQQIAYKMDEQGLDGLREWVAWSNKNLVSERRGGNINFSGSFSGLTTLPRVSPVPTRSANQIEYALPPQRLFSSSAPINPTFSVPPRSFSSSPSGAKGFYQQPPSHFRSSLSNLHPALRPDRLTAKDLSL